MKGLSIAQLKREVVLNDALVAVAECPVAEDWGAGRIRQRFADRYIKVEEIPDAIAKRNVAIICLCYDYAECGRNAVAIEIGVKPIHLFPISSWDEIFKIPI